jgi:hypothetical protein
MKAIRSSVVASVMSLFLATLAGDALAVGANEHGTASYWLQRLRTAQQQGFCGGYCRTQTGSCLLISSLCVQGGICNCRGVNGLVSGNAVCNKCQ